MTEEEIKKWNEKAKTGLLRSDSTLYQISNNLRRAMNDIVGDTGLGLYQFGIQTSSDYTEGGKLVIDQDKLKASLAEKPEEFKKLFFAHLSMHFLSHKKEKESADDRVSELKLMGINANQKLTENLPVIDFVLNSAWSMNRYKDTIADMYQTIAGLHGGSAEA